MRSPPSPRSVVHWRATCESRRMPTFSGFSDRAVAFYAELAAENTREFWAAHKAVYESEVRDPMRALVAALESELGRGKLFRPHQTSGSATTRRRTRPIRRPSLVTAPASATTYSSRTRVDPVGGGLPRPLADQSARFRAAVDDDATGPEVSDLVAGLRGNDFDIEGEALKTRPRGYDYADHPRIELLRCRSLMAVKVSGTPAWLAAPRSPRAGAGHVAVGGTTGSVGRGRTSVPPDPAGGPVSFSGRGLKPSARAPAEAPGPTLISIGLSALPPRQAESPWHPVETRVA